MARRRKLAHDGDMRSLSAHDLRRVAVAAECDPRSVQAYLEGRPVRSTTEARIRRALEGLHIADAQPQPGDGMGPATAPLAGGRMR